LNARTQGTTLISQLTCVKIDVCVEINANTVSSSCKKYSFPSRESQLISAE